MAIFNTGADPSMLPGLPPEMQNMQQGGANVAPSLNVDLSNLFGQPADTGAGAPPASAKSVTPAPAPTKPDTFFSPQSTPPAMIPEVMGLMNPQQQASMQDMSGVNRAKLVSRIGMLLSVFGGLGLPLLFGGAGAANAMQKQKQDQINSLMTQYATMNQPQKGSTETDAQRNLREKQAAHADAEAKLALDKIAHPEKYRNLTAGESKETRLSAKDFAQERDRMVKATEDARRAKMGGITVPYSNLEHEAMAADAEDSLAPNYPGVKQTEKFQFSRSLKQFIDELLQSQSDATVKATILKSTAPTIGGKKVKLTPSMKADMIGYIDAQKALKGLPVMTGEAGTPPAGEIPAQQKGGYFSNIFRAIEGK